MFDYKSIFFVLFFTILVFSWIFKEKAKIAKLYFFLIVFFLFVYSGYGIGLDEVCPEYSYYYSIFIIFVSLGMYISRKCNLGTSIDYNWAVYLHVFVDKNAKKILIIYLGLSLLLLLYPEFKLFNLFTPPVPDIKEHIAERFEQHNLTLYEIVISNIENILLPFFLLSLYKYRKNLILLSLFVFCNLYINYCKDAYIGRGIILVYIMLVFFLIYKYKPILGKFLIIAGLVVTPLLVIFMVQYTYIRLGRTASDLNFQNALEILMYQETSYPIHFSEILVNTNDAGIWRDYLIWLLTLPLPGFLKNFNVDFAFNVRFSEYLLGDYRESNTFFILLPGIVGESVYILGKYLFWIQGLWYGFLSGIVFKILNKYDTLYPLLIYSAIIMGYFINRGGTPSGYPFLLKQLLVFFLLLCVLKKNKIRIHAK